MGSPRKVLIRRLTAAIFLMAAAIYPFYGNNDTYIKDREGISSDIQNRYYEIADSASIMMEKGEWQKAESHILQALKTDPANPVNHLLFSNLGVCQTNLGQYSKALESFEIALIKSDKPSGILSNRARTYLAMSDEESALKDLSEAAKLDSLNLDAFKLKGMLLMRKGDFGNAEKDLSYFNRHSPTDTRILAELGRCASKKGEYKEAKSFYEESLKLDPEADVYLSIAHYQIEADDYNSADETIRQGLKKYPREGMLYLLRALLHKERFQNEEAEIDKKLAMEYGVDVQTIAIYFPGQPMQKHKKR